MLNRVSDRHAGAVLGERRTVLRGMPLRRIQQIFKMRGGNRRISRPPCRDKILPVWRRIRRHADGHPYRMVRSGA